MRWWCGWHPLAAVQPLTRTGGADYPIITYHEGLPGAQCIDQTFAAALRSTRTSLSALDADACDQNLRRTGTGHRHHHASGAFSGAKGSVAWHLLNADHLFPANVTLLSRYVVATICRDFAYKFIEAVRRH